MRPKDVEQLADLIRVIVREELNKASEAAVETERAAARVRKRRQRARDQGVLTDEAGNAIVTLPDWMPAEPWERWLEMRRKLRAPNTQYALNLAINKLAKYRDDGDEPADILNTSYLNRWIGLFPSRKPGSVAPKRQTAPANKPQCSWSGCSGWTPTVQIGGKWYCQVHGNAVRRGETPVGAHPSQQPVAQASPQRSLDYVNPAESAERIAALKKALRGAP